MLTKTCEHCEGTGAHQFDDDEYVPCLECCGRGELTLWMRLRDGFDWYIGTRIDRLKEWAKYTRAGTRYWRRYGKEQRARRLAEGKTEFQLQALHGERLNRLRVFADAIEINGYNVGHQYRVESRLVAEAARACEIAKERAQ